MVNFCLRPLFEILWRRERIGEDNSRLLGGMLITELQLAAMERVDMPENERKDFFLYVDEFQNFATPSFANILSEARKYRLSLIMAHQYITQLDETVADAVFGNVGTIVTFRIGATDAEMLAKEFAPTFIEEDIVNLSKYRILLKLMINGVASQPFSAMTVPPIGSATGSAEKVIKVSRERYGRHRDIIADKILRWSGMGGGGDELSDDENIPVVPVEKKKTAESTNEKVKVLEEKKSDNVEKDEILVDELPKPLENNMAVENVSVDEEKYEEKMDLLPGLVDNTSFNNKLLDEESDNVTNYPQPFKKVVPDLDDIKKMESEDDGKEKIEKNISNQNSNGALSQISDQPQKKKRKRNRKKKNSSMTSPQTNGNNIENKSVTVQPKKMQPDDIVKFD